VRATKLDLGGDRVRGACPFLTRERLDISVRKWSGFA